MRPAPSAKPLVEKLQLKTDRLYAPNVPRSVKPRLRGVRVSKVRPAVVEATLLFAKDQAELRRVFALVASRLGDDALVWICYPKGGSGVETDLNRDRGWAPVDDAGLVGVRQVAVDDVWSALRFRRSSSKKAR
ncbi:MAG: hypothetical protein SFW67_08740 [Myxococcaceae bacterium]|nr:hypothetical protein [Myxococcaceae bacterium]